MTALTALAPLRGLRTLARKVEDLLALHRKLRDAISILEERLAVIETRLDRLETAQSQVIAGATGAAGAVAGGIIADAVTRITRLEGRTEQLESRLILPGPKRP
jgi:hypothetical protein